MTAHQSRELILGVYDTVADPSLWPDVLSRFAENLNAAGCIVFEFQFEGVDQRLTAPIMSGAYDRLAVETYLEKCLEYEVRDQRIFERHSLEADGIDLIEDDVLGNSLSELKQQPNVQILEKLGILHRAAGLLNKDNRSVARFSVQYGVGRGRTTDAEHRLLAEVLPHIAKALDLGRPARQLAKTHRSMLEAMDRLTIGACLLDGAGSIVAMNHEFRRQIEEFPVFSQSAAGRLEFSKPGDQKLFADLMADADNHGKFGARPRKEAISSGRSSFLCVELVPLTRSEDLGSGIFGGHVLYSIDTSRPMPCSIEPIRQAFGLTEAEAALIEAISQGLTNAQIAERRDRSVATVNVQVKSILSKTGCTTRTQLVRLLMGFGTQVVA